MGNIKSAIKQNKQSKRNRVRNLEYKDRIKKLHKSFKLALAKGKEEAEKVIKALFSAIDKAALKRIIPKNKASRQKSRLQKLLQSK